MPRGRKKPGIIASATTKTTAKTQRKRKASTASSTKKTTKKSANALVDAPEVEQQQQQQQQQDDLNSQLHLTQLGFAIDPSSDSLPPESTPSRRSSRLRQSVGPAPRYTFAVPAELRGDEDGEYVPSQNIQPAKKKRRVSTPTKGVIKDVSFENYEDDEDIAGPSTTTTTTANFRRTPAKTPSIEKSASTTPHTKRKTTAKKTPAKRVYRRRTLTADDNNSNTLTQMSRAYNWLSSENDDVPQENAHHDSNRNSGEDEELHAPPAPRTPQKPIRMVVPSSHSPPSAPLTPVVGSGGSRHSLRVIDKFSQTPIKAVRFKSIEQENNAQSSRESNVDTEDSRNGEEVEKAVEKDDRVIRSSQWWEDQDTQDETKWEVSQVDWNEVPLCDIEEESEEEERKDDIAPTFFKKKSPISAAPMRPPPKSPPKTLDAMFKSVQQKPEKVNMEAERKGDELSEHTSFDSLNDEEIPFEEAVEQLDEDEGEQEQTTTLASNVILVQESQLPDIPNITSIPDGVIPSSSPDPLTSTPRASSPITPYNDKEERLLLDLSNEDSSHEQPHSSPIAANLDIVFETQSQEECSQKHLHDDSFSQMWSGTAGNDQSGSIPMSSIPDEGLAQWKLRKFGPSQPELTISQILPPSEWDEEDDDEI